MEHYKGLVFELGDSEELEDEVDTFLVGCFCVIKLNKVTKEKVI